ATSLLEVQTPGIVGSRIRITNRDGASHIEEVVEWQPDQRLRLRIHGFSRLLSRLATEFEETWEFQRPGTGTRGSAFSGPEPNAGNSGETQQAPRRRQPDRGPGEHASATSIACQFLPFSLASRPALPRATTKSTSSWQRKKPSQ